MKTLSVAAASLVILAVSSAHAGWPVGDGVQFGAKDGRGAYQEIHIKSFQIRADYFPRYVQTELTQDAADQAKNQIYSDGNRDMSGWGTPVQIVFQDGELRTENPNNRVYKQVDPAKPLARLFVTLAFDNAKQASTGLYQVDGVVTLVSGETYAGPIGVSTKLDASFEEITELGNASGKGKNDGGRVNMVGLTSRTTDMSVGLLKQALGSYLEIVYP